MSDEVKRIAADLLRQRADLEREKVRRQNTGEELTRTVEKLAELRTRIEKVHGDPERGSDPVS